MGPGPQMEMAPSTLVTPLCYLGNFRPQKRGSSWQNPGSAPGYYYCMTLILKQNNQILQPYCFSIWFWQSQNKDIYNNPWQTLVQTGCFHASQKKNMNFSLPHPAISNWTIPYRESKYLSFEAIFLVIKHIGHVGEQVRWVQICGNDP